MTLRAKLRWVSLLYFVEGLPFGIVYDALPVYFRLHGVSLRQIGLLSLLELPWSIKVLWSPLVDRLGNPRRWILGALFVLAGAHLAIPVFDASQAGPWLWFVLLLLTTASATQDIAIDGAFVRLLKPGEEGVANGVRASAYRVAILVGGGGMLLLLRFTGWSWIFAAAAALFILLAVLSAQAPVTEPPPHRPLKEWGRSLWLWLRRPSALFVFAFILLYKLGDQSMGRMVSAFWLDRGMRPEEIGFMTTMVGSFVTMAGALAGGWYTSRKGIFSGIWVLGLTQAFSNLGYAGVAYFNLGRPFLYGASLFESFTQGLGTAALLAFLTRSCDKEHAATQYALLSAIFGFTRTAARAASGWATEMLGFSSFFALTFLLSFPAYAFLPWVRQWLRESEK